MQSPSFKVECSKFVVWSICLNLSVFFLWTVYTGHLDHRIGLHNTHYFSRYQGIHFHKSPLSITTVFSHLSLGLIIIFLSLASKFNKSLSFLDKLFFISFSFIWNALGVSHKISFLKVCRASELPSYHHKDSLHLDRHWSGPQKSVLFSVVSELLKKYCGILNV